MWTNIDPRSHTFLVSRVPSRFQCTDRHNQLFRLFHWPPWWPNQSGNIWCSTPVSLRWGFWILNDVFLLWIRFIVCLPLVFAQILVRQVIIPVKPICSIGNAFGCAILITFRWMLVTCLDSGYIQYFNSSSKEVHWRQSWWLWWSFWQLTWSCTILYKVCQGWINDLFSIQNVSNGCSLFDLSAWVLLDSTEVRLPCQVSNKSRTWVILCNFLSSVSLVSTMSFSASDVFNTGSSPPNIR
jgi:hypothetical protein